MDSFVHLCCFWTVCPLFLQTLSTCVFSLQLFVSQNDYLNVRYSVFPLTPTIDATHPQQKQKQPSVRKSRETVWLLWFSSLCLISFYCRSKRTEVESKIPQISQERNILIPLKYRREIFKHFTTGLLKPNVLFDSLC